MADATDKKIEAAKAKVQVLEKKLQNLAELFARNGKITSGEEKALNRVRDRIEAMKKKIDELKAKKGVYDFEEGDTVTINTEKKWGEAKYFSDSYFKDKFNLSIKNWTLDGRIALNSVRAYMVKEEDPAGLEIADIVKVVTIIFPPAAVIGTVVDLATITEKAFNSALKARSKKPSLNQIHSAWAEALTQLANADHSSAYNKFVAEWKKKNGVSGDKTWTNLFGPACAKFATDHMPSGNDVQKAFLKKILSTVEDSYDWDSKAGYADIELIELAGNFSQYKGQLDDVPEQLLKTLKTVWRGALVIDLPVEINFTVKSVTGTEKAEIKRSSRSSGSTNFSLKSGDKEVFKAFMKKKAYTKMKVSELTLDSI